MMHRTLGSKGESQKSSNPLGKESFQRYVAFGDYGKDSKFLQPPGVSCAIHLADKRNSSSRQQEGGLRVGCKQG